MFICTILPGHQSTLDHLQDLILVLFFSVSKLSLKIEGVALHRVGVRLFLS